MIQHFKVLHRILRAWNRVPVLRLGQFILNAVEEHYEREDLEQALYYAGNERLAEMCEEYADKLRR